LTGQAVNGSGKGTRSGALVLALLASPLNCEILTALAQSPMQQSDLRRETGSPAQTTLRAQLRKLSAIGAIEKERQNRFPGAIEHRLTERGQELLAVTEVTKSWLAQTPEGPVELGGSAGKAAIKALVEGWSTTMLRLLATKPLTLTELDGMIASLNYPSLERRLGAMRLAGLIAPQPGDGRGTPYAVTDWGRRGAGPLAAAARWERCHIPDKTSSLSRLDVETAFLMAMPLVRLSEEASGSCRMVADVSSGGKAVLAGVMVEGNRGRIRSCTTRLEGYPDAWASGSVSAWLAALVEGDLDRLEMGGDCGLVRSVIDGLQACLFTGGLSAAFET
jgi:DNA-binding HxlR family transcriptional regulator